MVSCPKAEIEISAVVGSRIFEPGKVYIYGSPGFLRSCWIILQDPDHLKLSNIFLTDLLLTVGNLVACVFYMLLMLGCSHYDNIPA